MNLVRRQFFDRRRQMRLPKIRNSVDRFVMTLPVLWDEGLNAAAEKREANEVGHPFTIVEYRQNQPFEQHWFPFPKIIAGIFKLAEDVRTHRR